MFSLIVMSCDGFKMILTEDDTLLKQFIGISIFLIDEASSYKTKRERLHTYLTLYKDALGRSSKLIQR